jgi:hypothetical protein
MIIIYDIMYAIKRLKTACFSVAHNFGFSYFMQALIYVVMIVIHCDMPTLCLP